MLGFKNNNNFPDNNFNIQDIYEENSSLLDFENNENSNLTESNIIKIISLPVTTHKSKV